MSGIKSSNVIFNDIRFRSLQGSTFGVWGDFYVNNPSDYTVNSDTSLDLLPDTDTTIPMTSGVYKNQLLSGDFSASFNLPNWGATDSGILGITILDAATKNILDPIYFVEIASYSAFNSGRLFYRRRSPYSYSTAFSNGVAIPRYFKCTRVGGTVTFGVGTSASANQYEISTTFSSDCYVGVSYYASTASNNTHVKSVENFSII